MVPGCVCPASFTFPLLPSFLWGRLRQSMGSWWGCEPPWVACSRPHADVRDPRGMIRTPDTQDESRSGHVPQTGCSRVRPHGRAAGGRRKVILVGRLGGGPAVVAPALCDGPTVAGDGEGKPRGQFSAWRSGDGGKHEAGGRLAERMERQDADGWRQKQEERRAEAEDAPPLAATRSATRSWAAESGLSSGFDSGPPDRGIPDPSVNFLYSHGGLGKVAIE